jgi:hypothetical protein
MTTDNGATQQKTVRITPNERFQKILKRIQKTERGVSFVKWMNEQGIKVKFVQDVDITAHYREQVVQNDEEEKDADAPQTIEKKLYLNWDQPDEILIAAMYREIRRAWQNDLMDEIGPGNNILSSVLIDRFAEADAKGFAIAMAIDLARSTNDLGPIHMMTKDKDLQPRIPLAMQVAKDPETDFDGIQRAAFDTFFMNKKWTIRQHDQKRIEEHIDLWRGYFSKQTEVVVKKQLNEIWEERAAAKARKDKDYRDKSLVIYNLDNEPLKTVSIEDLARFGEFGFAESDANYLTDVEAPFEIDDELYIGTTPKAAAALDDFIKGWRSAALGLNMDGTPYTVSTADVAEGYRQEQAADHERRMNSEADHMVQDQECLKTIMSTLIANDAFVEAAGLTKKDISKIKKAIKKATVELNEDTEKLVKIEIVNRLSGKTPVSQPKRKKPAFRI